MSLPSLRTALPRLAARALRPQAPRCVAAAAAPATSAAACRRRELHVSAPRARSDDPGGKPNDGSHPTVYDDFFNLLSSPTDNPSITVHSLSDTAITLADGLVIAQPVLFLNGSVLLWDAPPLNVKQAAPSGWGWEAWDDECWKVVEVVEPRPEVIIFGTGATVCPPPQRIKSYLHSLGIQLTVESTRNACSTYNLLIEEGRTVAAALLPSERRPTQKVPNDEGGEHLENRK